LDLTSNVPYHGRKRRITIEKEKSVSIEFLSDLENKVDAIISNYEQLKQENSALKGVLDAKTAALTELENENKALKNNLSDLQSDSQRHQEKLRAAAEKVQGLIAKIEGV
jgi:predicted  nucleic acid-binding Zn-ribbon protein